MAKTIKKKRWSKAASVAMAVASFPFALILAVAVVSGVGLTALAGMQAAGIEITTTWHNIFDRGWIFLTLVLATFAPLALYRGLRSIIVLHDARYCSECDYDLTGNVSGVCPECGELI